MHGNKNAVHGKTQYKIWHATLTIHTGYKALVTKETATQVPSNLNFSHFAHDHGKKITLVPNRSQRWGIPPLSPREQGTWRHEGSK